ncbi:DNA/RNA non-specific endonuclease [Bacteroidetes/Chlorobi group bacterium ChocPot_Mid]|nr:MAG: DNA/RNA non-specific endonuclease [Bacteroidetes/Chlorobi group bacterium ChocPot_Mid]
MRTLITFLLFFAFACHSSTEPIKNNNITLPKINSIHTALGVPTDNDSTDDYYIIRYQYVISYNHNKNSCNWVAWNLNADWYGDVERYSGNFKKDTTLPTGWYQVKHEDYTNSGYDRGHMVRSEERTKTVTDNLSTFFMTNILPQRPDLNRGVWLDLEYYCEDLCKKQNKELYIVAGGIFHSDSTLMGKGIVPVPDSCFKIIVVMNRGQGLKDVTTSTEVIAVVMPNIDGISKDKWSKYKTTIRRIESSTGYDFLNSVSKEVQNILENR